MALLARGERVATRRRRGLTGDRIRIVDDTGGSADDGANIDAADAIGEGTADSADHPREESAVTAVRVAAAMDR